jgi:hypothetical protein
VVELQKGDVHVIIKISDQACGSLLLVLLREREAGFRSDLTHLEKERKRERERESERVR